MKTRKQESIKDAVTIVIFGASGDLTHRKLIPALFAAYSKNLLPENFSIIGVARRDDQNIFKDNITDSLYDFSTVKINKRTLKKFIDHIFYFKGDITNQSTFVSLKGLLSDTSKFPENRLYYLSTIPNLFEEIVSSLKKNKLISTESNPWTRVVVEKPFGRDLKSAVNLNNGLLKNLDESQIYRIDHFLGKETVQNILSFRFANTVFEPLFNRNYIDHIQISASEKIGVEKGRGGYYDEYGALRDMVSNHLLQLLCLVTMDAPSDLSANAIRNEKVKILRSTRIDQNIDISEAVYRGQYNSLDNSDQKIKGYLEEEKIHPDSKTETYIAMRLLIDNWRWSDIPILLRTGKRMKKKNTEIVIQFKVPPLELFQQIECEGDICDIKSIKPNMLIFQIQPNEGIYLKMGIKRPGMRFLVEDVKMDFSYSGQWSNDLPEAYERLLLDVMSGDPTLFTRSDEVEAEWKVVQPILDQLDKIKLYQYPSMQWGVDEANNLFRNTNGSWRND